MHVVITGAAGIVGRCVVEALAARHTLTLLDRHAHPTHPTVIVDLADLDALRAALPSSADVRVHMGATPTEGPYETILRNNILAMTHVFEESRRRGMPRLVFASTIQVYGALGQRTALLPLKAARDAEPNSHYALSKLHGEHLGAMYARKHGMSVIAVRLGWYVRPGDAYIAPTGAPPYMLGIRDARQLFQRCVEASHSGFSVINGLSRCGGAIYDLEAGRQAIGFDPQDSAEAAMREHHAALNMQPAGTGATVS